jgi:hypothetical protein
MSMGPPTWSFFFPPPYAAFPYHAPYVPGMRPMLPGALPALAVQLQPPLPSDEKAQPPLPSSDEPPRSPHAETGAHQMEDCLPAYLLVPGCACSFSGVALFAACIALLPT